MINRTRIIFGDAAFSTTYVCYRHSEGYHHALENIWCADQRIEFSFLMAWERDWEIEEHYQINPTTLQCNKRYNFTTEMSKLGRGDLMVELFLALSIWMHNFYWLLHTIAQFTRWYGISGSASKLEHRSRNGGDDLQQYNNSSNNKRANVK